MEHVFLPKCFLQEKKAWAVQPWLLKRLVRQVRYGVFLLRKVDQRIKGMFGRISLCFFPGMQVAQCAERPWDENFNPKLTVATMKSPWCHLAHTSVCPAKPFQNATWTKIWNLAWLWSRTVRVQQGTLRSSACSGGMGGEHSDPGRRGTLRSSACSWGPAEEAALDEKEAKLATLTWQVEKKVRYTDWDRLTERQGN